MIVYHYNGKMSLKQLFEDDFPLFSVTDKNHMTVEDVAADAVRHKCHWIDTRVHSSSESPTLFYEVTSRSDRCEGKRIQVVRLKKAAILLAENKCRMDSGR